MARDDEQDRIYLDHHLGIPAPAAPGGANPIRKLSLRLVAVRADGTAEELREVGCHVPSGADGDAMAREAAGRMVAMFPGPRVADVASEGPDFARGGPSC